MPDERGATMVGGVEAEVRALRNDFERRFDSLEQSMAEFKGAFGQMDKRIGDMSSRMSNTEVAVSDLRKDIRQVFYMVMGAIAVPILLEIIKKVIR